MVRPEKVVAGGGSAPFLLPSGSVPPTQGASHDDPFHAKPADDAYPPTRRAYAGGPPAFHDTGGLAHLGHPYEGECIAMIRKHPCLYADISALHYRPFQLYHSLMLVQEYGVWQKVLFGTDFPFTTVDATLDGLRSLNKMVEGTHLPRLDESQIEAMIHRDSLALLGLE